MLWLDPLLGTWATWYYFLSSITYLKKKLIIKNYKVQIQTISNQVVMLASSNVEGASRMCNLQGDTHDLYEDEGLKIYLITLAWKKEKKIKHIEIMIQV